MRLPSFKTVTQSATNTLFRFPIPLVIAFVGTALAIHMVEYENDIADWTVRLLFTCFIGLPCMLGCALFAERSSGKLQKLGITVIGLLLVFVYWLWYAPDKNFDEEKLFIVFSVLNICMHLWVAVAAYIGRRERVGFWRFNEELFIRIILSVLFSGVLFAGLAIAIVSMDELFKLDINSKVYAKLYFLIIGVFNTWFFLAGVPKNYEELRNEIVFPKWLKVFTQYILIPLTILYLLILYAYGFKIVIEWSLPKGWVSMLVMCYSLVGVLATLLVYPLRDSTDNAWVKLFARFFFIAIMPLVILLFVAIGARVSEYGITEPRYYLLMLGSWLAFIAIYFTVSKQKSIKLIPVSLLILGLLSLAGPWSAFSVSGNSQKNRLKEIFVKYEMLETGKTIKASKEKVKEEDAVEIEEIINYMVHNGYLREIDDMFGQNIPALAENMYKKYDSRWNARAELKDSILSLAYIDNKAIKSNYVYLNVFAETSMYDVSGYAKAYSVENWYPRSNRSGNQKQVIDEEANLSMQYDDDNKTILFLKDEEEIAKIKMTDLVEKLVKKGDAKKLPVDELTLTSEGKLKVKMVIHNINISGQEHNINQIDADLLFQ